MAAVGHGDVFVAALGLYQRAFAITQMSNNARDATALELVAQADEIVSKSIFKFFELPAEIRDIIYDMCFVDYRGAIHCSKPPIQYLARNTTINKVRRICRQMKQEYEARAREQNTDLVLHAVDPWKFDILEKIVLHYPRVHVIMETEDPRRMAEPLAAWLMYHIEAAWILKLLREEQHVTFYFRLHNCTSSAQRDPLKEILFVRPARDTAELCLCDAADGQKPGWWTTGAVMEKWSKTKLGFEAAEEPAKVWSVEE